MKYRIPQEVQTILNKFTEAGFQIFIVGGAVRDLLLNRLVKDWDFTTNAKPEEILKIFPEGFYDNKFGTVGIPSSHLGGEAKDMQSSHLRGANTSGVNVFEITTMRKEGEYQDTRHPSQVFWTDKIEEDLARRDFTINSMALATKGEIIDPFKGQEDINKKIISAVGDPNKRFKEDALRLMRAVRIATELGFEIEEKTFQAIQKNAQLIKEISYERVRDELFKILASANPYIGIVKLREAGILPMILPELERCFGISQKGPKHARVYDIGEHSLLTLRYCPSPDPLVRFACLVHDIGKTETIQEQADGNVTFYNHDVVGGHLVLQIAKRFNLSKKQTDKLYKLVRWHLFTVDENQTDSAIRRFIKNIGIENINDMMDLRVADRLGGGTEKAVSWRMEKFKERIDQVLIKPFSISDLKVTGTDVMGILNITPGPKVGEILNQLFQEVLEDSSKNNREYLVKRLKSLK